MKASYEKLVTDISPKSTEITDYPDDLIITNFIRVNGDFHKVHSLMQTYACLFWDVMSLFDNPLYHYIYKHGNENYFIHCFSSNRKLKLISRDKVIPNENKIIIIPDNYNVKNKNNMHVFKVSIPKIRTKISEHINIRLCFGDVIPIGILNTEVHALMHHIHDNNEKLIRESYDVVKEYVNVTDSPNIDFSHITHIIKIVTSNFIQSNIPTDLYCKRISETRTAFNNEFILIIMYLHLKYDNLWLHI